MPVHPTLAAMLAEWKLEGWPSLFGQAPGPDDLVAPFPPGGKAHAGSMRKNHNTWLAFQGDLDTLELRRRRVHDLRRTMISLSRMDGARGDMLKACTHGPSKAVLDLYTTFTWESLCAEVGKLKVRREPRGEVVGLPRATEAGCADSADSAPGVVVEDRTGTVAGRGPQVEPQWAATCVDPPEKLASPTGFEPVSPA